jgi:hypothetical protein
MENLCVDLVSDVAAVDNLNHGTKGVRLYMGRASGTREAPEAAAGFTAPE